MPSLSISESLEVLSFQMHTHHLLGWPKKFVWAFVWKNPNEHFGQPNSLALSLQGNSRAACLPLLFGGRGGYHVMTAWLEHRWG